MNDVSASPLRLALGGAVTMGCAMGIGRFVYTPILPFMAEAIPLTASQAGWIASANFLGYLIGALATSLRLPGAPRFWLLGALIASAVTTGAVGLSSSFAAIAGLRFLGGAASAFALVFASTRVLQALAQAGKTELAALHFGGVGIGIAVSSLVILLPVAWDGMWLVSGALALAGVPVAALLIPPSPEVRPAAPTQSMQPAATPMAGGLLRLILAYGLFGFGYVITATFLIAMIRGTASLRVFEPVTWLVVGLAGVPSVWFWMTCGRRIGLERAYALSCAVEAVGVLFSLWASATGVLVAAVLLGGTIMGVTALGLEAARVKAPANPRRVVGLMTAVFGVGQIIGPSVAGRLRDLTGSFSTATIAATVALLIAAALTVRPSRT